MLQNHFKNLFSFQQLEIFIVWWFKNEKATTEKSWIELSQFLLILDLRIFYLHCNAKKNVLIETFPKKISAGEFLFIAGFRLKFLFSLWSKFLLKKTFGNFLMFICSTNHFEIKEKKKRKLENFSKNDILFVVKNSKKCT